MPRPEDELLVDELLDEEPLDDELADDEVLDDDLLDDELADDEVLDDDLLDDELADDEVLDDDLLDDELADDVLLVDVLPLLADDEPPLVVSVPDEVLVEAPPVEELPPVCESVAAPMPVLFPPTLPVDSLPVVCSGVLTSLAQPAEAPAAESATPPNTESKHLDLCIANSYEKRW